MNLEMPDHKPSGLKEFLEDNDRKMREAMMIPYYRMPGGECMDHPAEMKMCLCDNTVTVEYCSTAIAIQNQFPNGVPY